jgi:peptide/nickel transport system substrate-binding protein
MGARDKGPVLPLEMQALTRRTLLRNAGVGLAVFSPTVAALAGCGGSDDPKGSPATSASGAGTIDELRWSILHAPSGLDITTNFSGDSMVVMYLMNETLVGYSPTGELVPQLASEVANPSPAEYVYTLRDGVTFHDGSPLTADDVVFSIKHAMREESQVAYYFGLVSKVAKTGANEVTITLKEPSAVFAYSPVYAPIIPKAYAREKGKKLGAPGGLNWVATGPYKLETFQNDSVAVVANDDYWGEPPTAAKVSFSFIGDPQTRQLAVRSNEIDGTFTADLADSKQWEAIQNAKLTTAPGMGVWFLGMNVEAEPWDDVHARRAFAHAYNQEGVINAILGGHGGKATVMVPPAQWVGLLTPDEVSELYAGLPSYPYDLEKAKTELAQSASPDGFSVSVRVPDTAPPVRDALLAVAADLKKIGITLEVNTVPGQQWIDHAYAHKDLSLTVMEYGPDYPDPSNFLAISYDSTAAVPNGFNLANYKNPKVDDLLARQAEETDKAARIEALTEILRIGQEDLPYLNLWWEDVSVALNDKYEVTDFNPLTGAFTPWPNVIRSV